MRSSRGLFSIGVPVSRRRRVLSCDRFLNVIELAFLIFCASSMMRYDASSLRRNFGRAAPTPPTTRTVKLQTTTCGVPFSLTVWRISSRSASEPWYLTHVSAGHHSAISRVQFSRAETGATTMCGPASRRRAGARGARSPGPSSPDPSRRRGCRRSRGCAASGATPARSAGGRRAAAAPPRACSWAAPSRRRSRPCRRSRSRAERWSLVEIATWSHLSSSGRTPPPPPPPPPPRRRPPPRRPPPRFLLRLLRRSAPSAAPPPLLRLPTRRLRRRRLRRRPLLRLRRRIVGRARASPRRRPRGRRRRAAAPRRRPCPTAAASASSASRLPRDRSSRRRATAAAGGLVGALALQRRCRRALRRRVPRLVELARTAPPDAPLHWLPSRPRAAPTPAPSSPMSPRASPPRQHLLHVVRHRLARLEEGAASPATACTGDVDRALGVAVAQLAARLEEEARRLERGDVDRAERGVAVLRWHRSSAY